MDCLSAEVFVFGGGGGIVALNSDSSPVVEVATSLDSVKKWLV